MTVDEYLVISRKALVEFRTKLIGDEPEPGPEHDAWMRDIETLKAMIKEAVERRIYAHLDQIGEPNAILVMDGPAWDQHWRWLRQSMPEVEKAWLQKEYNEKNAESLMAFLEEEAQRNEE